MGADKTKEEPYKSPSWQSDEVVFGNLKAPNKTHDDFDEHVSRVGHRVKTELKVNNE